MLEPPRTSLGVLYSETQVASLRAWMAAGTPGPALATAGPGSGLTTLITLLIREIGLECVWIGCGTVRIKALLEQAGANPLSVTMRRKIIVIDEADALPSGDSMALSETLAFAKSSPPVPVLFAMHVNRSQKSVEFAKHWPKFEMGRPTPAVMHRFLSKIVAERGMQIDQQKVLDLSRSTRGDVRAALMALDLAGRAAPEADVDTKDEATDGLDLTEAVLRGERGNSVRECLTIFGMESAVVSAGIYENYLSSLGKDDMECAMQVAEDFSAADCVDRYLYSHQAWDMYDVYGVFSLAAPSIVMHHKRKTKPKSTLTVTKFGTMWSKVYNMCAKTKHVRNLAAKYAEAGIQPLAPCDMSWVRGCLRTAVERKDEDLIRKVAWPLAAADVLSMARMDASPGGSTWYKQTVHARVKKLLSSKS